MKRERAVMNVVHALPLLLCGLGGYAIGAAYEAGLIGVVLGCLLGGGMVGLGLFIERRGARKLLWGIAGAVVGLLAGGLFTQAVLATVPHGGRWGIIPMLFFAYIGLLFALKVEKNPELFQKETPLQTSDAVLLNSKILDTSVIIDGRIADLAQTGFLEGTCILPHFILKELQHIADSSDSLKRVRGRRGLDILQKIQKMVEINVRIVDDDFPLIRDVDSKIVALAKRMSAKVVTNDFNLNKVAELQGVPVLNINQLCNALRPVVLPGEPMSIFVVKEGKEMGQGIAYLDDGTMIVVDDGRRWIGKTIDVMVTSVLQTAAGRMIFTRMRENRENTDTYPVAKSG
jgi:uncharacterized protein YacL